MNSEFTIAVHSLVYLAYRPDRMATSEAIANNVNTHPSRVRKVMSCLKKRNYVVTKEGLGGGYILHCSPESVTLAEIYRATSIGTMKPSWCSGTEEGDCLVACNMANVMDVIFMETEEKLLQHLESMTIRDVLERIKSAQAAALG
ncbi:MULTISPECIES: Rrf2 family transcriptional regulator [unclassified Paenibacillus]|uniref:RrF2 family transcriptional regulator n=1 Tax=unclassified Paenibacillus TaxID=185978 RepID=UPI000956884A|nr:MULTISPECIES: Rrf2 family transcriptional regulator [unclassified Paenibacillus]ASS68841.1 Rrf2 family transcriptional regulator [Paenibacillus sp. RUD330]SIR18346.1 Rrf2 family protein [Paenibacillus sp. RU4X]SIR20580.1 Rrf2 family protein [Paenibacillus sp. RU4T]